MERATGEVTTLTYDYRNRLTSVERRSTGGILLSEASYTYDVMDRLIVRSVNGVSQSTVYDGAHAWADFDAAGTAVARYLYGDRIDELLARWTLSGGTAWHLADKQGSIRDMVDVFGSVIGSRAFDAFGRIVAESGLVDRFAFQGREWEAAVGLYQFRARWYDPAMRQFVSEDPLGFGAGDWNTRRFVSNNPQMYTDPSGMLAVEYGTTGNNGSRTGAAAAGAVLGFICGYLDGWFDNKVPEADRSLNAWIHGGIGAGVGAAAGYALSGLTALPGAAMLAGAAAVVGVAGIANAARTGNANQAFVRVGCLAASFLMPRILPPRFGGQGGVPGGGRPAPPNKLPPLQAVAQAAGAGGRGVAVRPQVQLLPFLLKQLLPGLPVLPLIPFLPGGVIPWPLILPFLRPGPQNMAQPDPNPVPSPNPAPQPSGGGDVQPSGGAGNGNDGPEKPVVKPGAIGLGLDHNLSDLGRMGAPTYMKWFELSLTRVRPERANTSSYDFKKAFMDAANKASQIVFDLTDINITKALADGVNGFVRNNYTNAELHIIVTDIGLLGKTIFIKNGLVVRPVIQDGNVVGFTP